MALWTVAYLVIIRSYTAFAMLGMVWLVVIVCHRRRWPWVAAWCTVAVAVAAVAVGGCYSYYRMAPLAQQPLAALTAGGRPYEHHNDGIVENGRHVDLVGAHVKGYNSNSIGVVYVGGLDKNGKAADTRTTKQKGALIDLLKVLKDFYPGAKIVGHRDLSPDLNHNGIIEPTEWIKECPCFDAKKEYSAL